VGLLRGLRAAPPSRPILACPDQGRVRCATGFRGKNSLDSVVERVRSVLVLKLGITAEVGLQWKPKTPHNHLLSGRERPRL
jgi:hypothetical protein